MAILRGRLRKHPLSNGFNLSAIERDMDIAKRTIAKAGAVVRVVIGIGAALVAYVGLSRKLKESSSRRDEKGVNIP
jgi:hypothetical protein